MVFARSELRRLASARIRGNRGKQFSLQDADPRFCQCAEDKPWTLGHRRSRVRNSSAASVRARVDESLVACVVTRPSPRRPIVAGVPGDCGCDSSDKAGA